MTRQHSRHFLACCLLCLLTAVAQAQTTWHVDDDAPNDPGPGDPALSDPDEDGSMAHPFDAIQEGITAASAGDEVLVLDGVFTGAGNRDMDFGGKLVTVRSANGPAGCVVDCQGAGRAFRFHSGEGSTACVDGFTLRNGSVDWSSPGGGEGGAILVHNSAPTITRCTFVDNTAAGYGGALCYYEHSDASISHCVFFGNTAHGGGAISCQSFAGLTIAYCFIVGQTVAESGGGVLCNGDSTVSIINCLIARNDAGFAGGGVDAWDNNTVTIRNSTIAANTAVGWGGACALELNTSATLFNSILFFNGADGGPQIALLASSSVAVSYSDVEGGLAGVHVGTNCTASWSGGNIDEDPTFIDPDGPDGTPGTADDDLRLSAGSACIDAGDNSAVEPGSTTDLDGNPRFVDDPAVEDSGIGSPPIVDMGAYERQVVGDGDGDGVPDSEDVCPNTPSGLTVDCQGRPRLDLDNDCDVDGADIQLMVNELLGV